MKPSAIVVSSLLCFVLLVASSEAFSTSSFGNLDIRQVSVASDGTLANHNSYHSCLSGDGRYVGFETRATNLAPKDTAEFSIYRHDIINHVTTKIPNNPYTIGETDLHECDQSHTGQFVVFTSTYHSVTVPSGTVFNVFLYDATTGDTTLISQDYETERWVLTASMPSISGDGRYITYVSDSDRLVAGQPNNGLRDIFLYDRLTQQTDLISTGLNGSGADGFSGQVPSTISYDGRYIAFDSTATNLVVDDTNNQPDIFVYDRLTDQIERVSVANNGSQANGVSSYNDISDDGRYVVFWSSDPTLVPSNKNSQNIYLRDRLTGSTSLVSRTYNAAPIIYNISDPIISGNGRYVSYHSSQPDIVPEDMNNDSDVFLYDQTTQITRRMSVTQQGGESNYASDSPALSY